MKLNWGVLTGLLWLVGGAWVLTINLAPAGFWFSVDRIEIADAIAGQSPLMQVDRTIHRPFRGQWIVEVERQTRSGQFFVVCAARGESSYRTDATLPDPLALDWWTWPTECRPPPGRYRVETRWTILVPGFPEKSLGVLSNLFTIHPAAR